MTIGFNANNSPPRRARPGGSSAWLIVIVMCGMGAACEGQTAAVLAALGEGCALSSDCTEGLVCVFQVCHVPCETDEDCPVADQGQQGRCVVGEKPARVCLLDSESECARSSDCPGALVCAMDARCRNQCDSDRDCLAAQVCAGSTCAPPSDLDEGGRLALAPGADATGKPCAWNSDCPAEGDGRMLVCREGHCAVACLGDDRDCGRFERCTSSRPGEAGACELVGDPGSLYCSPHVDQPDYEIVCDCPGGATGTQRCKDDGSGYGPCEIGDVQCGAS